MACKETRALAERLRMNARAPYPTPDDLIAAAEILERVAEGEDGQYPTIERYGIVNREDRVLDVRFITERAAVQNAKNLGGCAVVREVYHWQDSELVWTPDGADTWPPAGRGR